MHRSGDKIGYTGDDDVDDTLMENSYPSTDHWASFPAQRTVFIGRENDLRKLQDMLAQSACRLLTLVGPGGIGKTRLAMQVAQQVQDAYANGVYFVPLQAVTSVRQVAPAIANQVHCPLYGEEDTLTQLKRYLGNKQALMILDNFEHLMDAVENIVELMDAAPGLKLLVTSREVLNLRTEWVWPVTGMRFPDDPEEAIAESHSAVHLFAHCARRLLPEFSLAAEKAQVIRICQLVDGVPLAIELAASWLKSLSCEAIATEIQHNLDFLDTNWRDVPKRHRSMRAVFDQSWNLLSDQEQETFKRLSIFSGGFSREAANQVVGASRLTISTLVDKSLLSYSADRYYLNTLLWQYAHEHILDDKIQRERLLEAHAIYYMNYLAERLHALPSDRGVLAEIKLELDNVHLAWERMVLGEQGEQLGRAIYCFAATILFQGYFHEGGEYFAQAAAAHRASIDLPEGLSARAALLCAQGWFNVRLNRFAKAEALLQECQHLLNEYGFRPEAFAGSDPLTTLSLIRLIQGNYAEALRLGHEAVANSAQHDDIANAGVANQVLGLAYLALGQLEEARQCGQTALSLTKQTGNIPFCAHCCDLLGNIAMTSRDFATAEHYFAESYRCRLEIGEQADLPLSVALLGKAKMAQGKYQETVEQLEKSIALYTNNGNMRATIFPISLLALTNGYLNQRGRSHELFLQAIEIARSSRITNVLLTLLAHIGEFMIVLGELNGGLTLLNIVRNHPMTEHQVRSDIQHHLGRYQKTIPKDVYEAALEAGSHVDLDTVLLNLEHDLNTVIANAAPTKTPPDDHQLYAMGLEPLSRREIEVLQCMADGLTNREIADQLIVTLGTVKSHTHSIYSKLGVKNRTQAIKLAREQNLI